MTRHTHTNDTELAMPRHTSSNRTAPVLVAFGLLATSIACGGEAAEPDAFAELAAGATVPEAQAATTPAAPGESELRSYPVVECDDLTGETFAQVMGLDVPVRMERSGDMCIYRWRPEGRNSEADLSINVNPGADMADATRSSMSVLVSMGRSERIEELGGMGLEGIWVIRDEEVSAQVASRDEALRINTDGMFMEIAEQQAFVLRLLRHLYDG